MRWICRAGGRGCQWGGGAVAAGSCPCGIARRSLNPESFTDLSVKRRKPGRCCSTAGPDPPRGGCRDHVEGHVVKIVCMSRGNPSLAA